MQLILKQYFFSEMMILRTHRKHQIGYNTWGAAHFQHYPTGL